MALIFGLGFLREHWRVNDNVELSTSERTR
jgi:hypothetical protein